jgi:hypothetical protein
MNAIHENNNNEDLVYDCEKLLHLLQSITHTESTAIQSKINLYLKELLDVEYVLIVPLLPASEETPTLSEGLIHVVNDKVLEKEFRFSVSCDFTNRAIYGTSASERVHKTILRAQRKKFH